MDQIKYNTMPKNKGGKKHATIHLPYFKQGDDMHGSFVHDETGKLNAKQSIQNHIDLLKYAINQLESINELIPDDNSIELSGDTHYIGIDGDEEIIDKLVLQDLAYIDSFDEEYSENDNEANEQWDEYEVEDYEIDGDNNEEEVECDDEPDDYDKHVRNIISFIDTDGILDDSNSDDYEIVDEEQIEIHSDSDTEIISD